MTEQEIWIKIVEHLASTGKRLLLRTLNGELLSKPKDKLKQELNQNYSDYIEYLKNLQFTLWMIFGLNVHIGFGDVKIDLDSGEIKHEY